MPAIRIIDDHLELANIGTNTHAQIDTHIAAADNYVKRDGSLALTADWDIGDTRKILADEVRARDGDGLKLYDDGGNGIFVEDGGQVGIGTNTPSRDIDIYNNVSVGGVGFNINATKGIALCTLRANTATKLAYFEFIDNNLDKVIGSLGIDRSSNVVAGCSRNDFFMSTRSGIGTKVHLATEDVSRLTIDSTGKIGIATSTPTALLDANSDIFRLRTAKTPASAGAAGNQGDICWDAGFIYVCTATNSWKKAAIAAW